MPSAEPGSSRSDNVVPLRAVPFVPERSVDVQILVADPVLATSLERVARRWSATRGDALRRPVLVIDVPTAAVARSGDLTAHDTPGGNSPAGLDPVAAVVRVIDGTPVAARDALESMLSAGIAGVVRADRVEELTAVLDALDSGMAPVPLELIADARTVPDLSPEQLDLLTGVLGGLSNREVGQSLGISLSVVKRQIRSLFDAFDVDDRIQLAVAASRLGFRATAD